jgi:hypothetical protein
VKTSPVINISDESSSDSLTSGEYVMTTSEMSASVMIISAIISSILMLANFTKDLCQSYGLECIVKYIK